MKINILKHRSFSTKIISVFVLGSFVPLLFLIVTTKIYVTNFYEEEVITNLTKTAKSFGLFTFDKIKTYSNTLEILSSDIEGEINSEWVGLFDSVKIIPIKYIEQSKFGDSKQPVFSYFKKSNGSINFKFEVLHESNEKGAFIIQGIVAGNKILGTEENNPFSEDLCIASSGQIIYCNKEYLLQSTKNLNTSSLTFGEKKLIERAVGNENYWLMSWELFLPTYFQSSTWDFVIFKKKNTIITALSKFEAILIPVGIAFFLFITLFVYRTCIKLMSPLKKLSEVTNCISTGDYSIQVDISTNDEFMDLANSFNIMVSNLNYQYKKNEVFSRLERRVMSNSDIHLSLKESLPFILETFDSSFISISIANPFDVSNFKTHIIQINSLSETMDYTCVDHKYISQINRNSELLTVDSEYINKFLGDSNYLTSSRQIWVKPIECDDDITAYICIDACNDSEGIKNSLAIIELSERLAVIYTTYKQQTFLYKKANIDDLTNLPNRNVLLEKLTNYWDKSIINHTSIAVLFIDLDKFKNVNDLSGHKAGDEVLVQVANRLNKCALNNSLLARLSGDEFCIVINEIKDEEKSIELAVKILDSFKMPFVIKDMSYFLGVSIGIAYGPKNCKSPQKLLENADIAMFKAKQEGRNQYVIFDERIDLERNTRLHLESHLHYALESNEISISYQPKIDLNSGRLVSVEALARWNHTEMGLVPTEKFISLSEESGLINELGEWILRKASYQYLDWISKGLEIDTIAVNVSAVQLASKKFVSVVESVLDETKIPPSCLDLEITESAFLNDEIFLVNELNKLHALGVHISIDDFGKEYSSLNYLKKIPFDILKIDREFVIDLEVDERDQHIVNVIINIGHTLGKKIVAEGIETIGQRDMLRNFKCDYGQGYLFSRPLSEIEFLEFAVKLSQNQLSTSNIKSNTI